MDEGDTQWDPEEHARWNERDDDTDNGMPCDDCAGTGKMHGKPCKLCKGTGALHDGDEIDPHSAFGTPAPHKGEVFSTRKPGGFKFGEGVKGRTDRLTEGRHGAEVVCADNRGPYVVCEGLEVRPKDPNRTQYRAGSQVSIKNKAMREGRLIAVMPNGERWVSVVRVPKKA